MLLLHPNELPVINGERLYLRPITDADTEDIVRWRNDPGVWQYFLFREPFTPEMHRNWLKNKVETGRVVQYIIVERERGASVGSVYFRDVDPVNESAEYGIFIGEPWPRRRGSLPASGWTCCACTASVSRSWAATKSPAAAMRRRAFRPRACSTTM